MGQRQHLAKLIPSIFSNDSHTCARDMPEASFGYTICKPSFCCSIIRFSRFLYKTQFSMTSRYNWRYTTYAWYTSLQGKSVFNDIRSALHESRWCRGRFECIAMPQVLLMGPSIFEVIMILSQYGPLRQGMSENSS